jgi:hypothetical protein
MLQVFDQLKGSHRRKHTADAQEDQLISAGRIAGAF